MNFEQPVFNQGRKIENSGADKIREFIKSKQEEINSADGNVICVMLIGSGTISREEMVQEMIDDSLESESISENEIESEQAKANESINKLIEKAVVVEENGFLRLAL